MNTLAMKFKNKEGKNTTLRIAKVKSGVTKSEVDALMDMIIAKNVFFEGLAELAEKVGSEVTTVSPLV